MHEDLDTPGPAELEQLADNEAGEGRMPNCQHFRRLARKWREDREDRDALRHALLQATTEKARARRVELKPSAERMAYAVALQGDHGITLAPLCKAPACAIEALSPFEGAPVVGLATIAMEREAISGMQYRLKHAGVAPQQPIAPPAEAQAQGGGEVVCDCDSTPENRYPHHDDCAVNTEPPSAPVAQGGREVAWRVPVLQSPFGERLDHGVRDGLVLVMHRGAHGWKAAGQGHALLAHQLYVKNVGPLCAASHEVAVVGLSGGGWRTVWARSDDDVTHPAPPSAPVVDRASAVKLAQAAAYASHHQHSYLPNTAEEARNWQPHEWVVDAILAAMLDTAPQQASAPVGVEEMQRRLDREESDHGRTIDQRDAAEDALGRMFQVVTGRVAEWSSAWGYTDAIEEVEEHIAALAQQPAAVDEAMVERAITAFFTHPGRGVNGTDDAMRAALTAALATQPGDSDNDNQQGGA